jgi:hypothetical protein
VWARSILTDDSLQAALEQITLTPAAEQTAMQKDQAASTKTNAPQTSLDFSKISLFEREFHKINIPQKKVFK